MVERIFDAETPTDTAAASGQERQLGNTVVFAANGQVIGGRWWVPIDGAPTTTALWQFWEVTGPTTGTLLAEYDMLANLTLTPGQWTDTFTLDDALTIDIVKDYVCCSFTDDDAPFAFIDPGDFPYGGDVQATEGRFRNNGAPTDFPSSTDTAVFFVDVEFEPVVVPPSDPHGKGAFPNHSSRFDRRSVTRTTGPSYVVAENYVFAGTPAAPPNTGTADIGVSVDLVTAGAVDRGGAANVGVTVALAATGGSDHEGTAALGVIVALAAVGETSVEGTAALGVVISLAATGEAPADVAEGSADVGVVVGLAAVGEADHKGSTDVGIIVDLATAGEAEHEGSADLDVQVAVSASGATDVAGSADLGLTVAVATTGATDATGTAGLGVQLTLAGAGEAAAEGSAGLGVAVGLAAAGEIDSEGTVDLGVTVDLAGTGSAPTVGQSDGVAHLAVAVDLDAIGETSAEGAVDIGIAVDISASGEAPDVDTAEGTAAFAVDLAIATSGRKPEAQGTANIDISLDVRAAGTDTSPPEEVDLMTAAFVIVTGVGQCIVDELEDTSGGVPDRVCLIVPGTIAWDACDCGQFAQTITADTPSERFPTPATDTRAAPCGPPLLVITVTASVVRCVPSVSDNGKPPTCDALMAAALRLEQDREAVRRGATCCLLALRKSYRITDFSVGATATVGEQGGCAGVELTYQFGLSNICCG